VEDFGGRNLLLMINPPESSSKITFTDDSFLSRKSMEITFPTNFPMDVFAREKPMVSSEQQYKLSFIGTKKETMLICNLLIGPRPITSFNGPLALGLKPS